MGGCGSKITEEEKRASEANKQVERDLARRKKEMTKEVKLLLLGTGASGKSTVAKQMQIIYLNGWGDKDREEFKPLILVNLLENMQGLLRGIKKLGLGPLSEEGAAMGKELLTIEPTGDLQLSQKHFDGIRSLWTEEQIIADAFKRRSEMQVSDSALYFFQHMDKYVNLDAYKITDEDILRVRKRTTGIIETDFTVGDYRFRMVDVGGQRNERKKWIHCFQDVTAIVFVAALSEYDQVLEEDDTTNRMRESLHLFEETGNNEWFSQTPILLFLNKNDIFETKATIADLGDYFPEYTGGKSAGPARKFISGMCTERNHASKQEREFYVHPTTATDTQNILTVFDAVQDIFLSKALDEFNF